MELLDDPDTAPIATSFGTKFLPRLDFIHYKADLNTVLIINKCSVSK